mgnify:CR=1 FL=1
MAEKINHKKFDSHIPEEARKHARAARDEMRKSIETLVPEGFFEHRRGARREMLMAMRSMLDAAIQRTDE